MVAGPVCGGSGVWALVSKVGAGDRSGMHTYFHFLTVTSEEQPRGYFGSSEGGFFIEEFG